MEARTINNGIFGSVAVAADTGKATLTVNEGAIKDNLFRETGLQKMLVNNVRFHAALTNPANYLAAKQTALVTMGNNLYALFRAEFERNLDLGLSQEEAKARTNKYINTQRDRLMEAHEADYPTKITETIIKEKLNKGKKGELIL